MGPSLVSVQGYAIHSGLTPESPLSNEKSLQILLDDSKCRLHLPHLTRDDDDDDLMSSLRYSHLRVCFGVAGLLYFPPLTFVCSPLSGCGCCHTVLLLACCCTITQYACRHAFSCSTDQDTHRVSTPSETFRLPAAQAEQLHWGMRPLLFSRGLRAHQPILTTAPPRRGPRDDSTVDTMDLSSSCRAHDREDMANDHISSAPPPAPARRLTELL